MGQLHSADGLTSAILIVAAGRDSCSTSSYSATMPASAAALGRRTCSGRARCTNTASLMTSSRNQQCRSARPSCSHAGRFGWGDARQTPLLSGPLLLSANQPSAPTGLELCSDQFRKTSKSRPAPAENIEPSHTSRIFRVRLLAPGIGRGDPRRATTGKKHEGDADDAVPWRSGKGSELASRLKRFAAPSMPRR